ncbi:MAG: class I SAM-dependent methyltransferase [Vicinamibacterales bacterium]
MAPEPERGEERLEDLLARLARERDAADDAYNQALTAVDRALARMPEIPHPPPAYDEGQLPVVNTHWDLLPDGPPVVDRSIKGALRGFVWRLVGPALERQRHFNAALVDHLNRNVAAHREAAKATATLIELVRHHLEQTVHFQQHLIRYLQTLTLYVDTKDRVVEGGAQVLNGGLRALTDDWLKRWETLGARDRRVLARLAEVDDLRVTASLAQQTSLTLKREVERLLERGLPGDAGGAAADDVRGGNTAGAAAGAGTGATAAAPPPDLDAYKYLGFEESFRGSQDQIRARLESYLPLFEGQTDVLDVGCGRGEFLELLAGRGIRARGIDLNHEMAEASRARGLDVTRADALGYLRTLPDASLGGLFAAQVVEHLEPTYLMQVLETAFHKLRPGAVMVLETVNVACWVAFFESYIRDLTHIRPLHPETLQYLVRASGFREVGIEFRTPIPEAERLQPVTVPDGAPAGLADFVETLNSNVEKLNGRLYTYLDYAVVGRR